MQGNTCVHFSFMPMSMRVLFTSALIVLGVGYIFAMIHTFASHAGRDGNPGLSVDDLIIAYSGSKSDTRLESALKGPMAQMLPTDEKDEIIAWVRREASKEEFEKMIAPIIERRCESCHGGSNPHIPNLKGYTNFSKVVEIDTGMDIFTLVRVSHIHLFGLTFIFFIMGFVFCHSYIKPLWIKCVVMVVPFLAIIFDIMSWYLTKIYTPFAWVVIISGGFMGLSFAFQWVVSIYQMWFYKLPDNVTDMTGSADGTSN